MTATTDCMGLATEERRDLADLLDSLTPEQWATPSLCAGWSVRDVVAHILSYEGSGGSASPERLPAGGSGQVGSTNSDWPPTEIERQRNSDRCFGPT